MKFTAPKELREKIESIKGIFAHKHPNITLGELFDKLCDLGLSELNPAKTAAPRKLRVKSLLTKSEVRRQVFKKANNKCENCGCGYINPPTENRKTV